VEFLKPERKFTCNEFWYVELVMALVQKT